MAPQIGEKYDPANPEHVAPLPGQTQLAVIPDEPPRTSSAGAAVGDASSDPRTAAAGPQVPGPDEAPKPRRVRAPRKPKADAAPRPPAPAKTGRPNKQTQREQRVGVALASLALPIGLFVNQDDGTAILDNAPGIAKAFAQLAEENATVARILDGATSSSAWIGVLIAVAPLVLAIMGNHGVVPPELADVFKMATATDAAPDAVAA